MRKKIFLSLLLGFLCLSSAFSLGHFENYYDYLYAPVSRSIEEIRAEYGWEDDSRLGEIDRFGETLIIGETAYIAEPNKGIHVLDLSEPDAPHTAGFFRLPGVFHLQEYQGRILAESYTDLLVLSPENGTLSLDYVIEDILPYDSYHLLRALYPNYTNYDRPVPDNEIITNWTQRIRKRRYYYPPGVKLSQPPPIMPMIRVYPRRFDAANDILGIAGYDKVEYFDFDIHSGELAFRSRTMLSGMQTEARFVGENWIAVRDNNRNSEKMIFSNWLNETQEIKLLWDLDHNADCRISENYLYIVSEWEYGSLLVIPISLLKSRPADQWLTPEEYLFYPLVLPQAYLPGDNGMIYQDGYMETLQLTEFGNPENDVENEQDSDFRHRTKALFRFNGKIYRLGRIPQSSHEDHIILERWSIRERSLIPDQTFVLESVPYK